MTAADTALRRDIGVPIPFAVAGFRSIPSNV
jgi:hypothetical protein